VRSGRSTAAKLARLLHRKRFPPLPLPLTMPLGRLALAVTLILISSAAAAGTPSFVCTKARTWVEKTICASDRLSALDLELATVYARLLRVTSGETERSLTAEQRRWWATRDECRREATPTECLEWRYGNRIGALRNRRDYTEARPGPVELPPESISAVGEGWSRGLSGYVKAIRACLRKAPAPVARIGNAWEDPEREQAVVLRMAGPAGETWVCVARRNGSEVLAMRAANAYEPLPPEGPLFYPDPNAPPAGACGKPVQVLDEHEAPVGWVGPACDLAPRDAAAG
jgi:uncharacterized protein